MSTFFIDHIVNFAPLNDHIATSGQPDRDIFPLIKKNGYQLIINLATSASSNHIPEEEQIIHDLGMEYIHIPVLWESPQPDQFEAFSQILEQNKDKNILVHCALNYRVSCFIFLYQVLYLHVDPEAAWWSVLEIWDPNSTWRAFLNTILNQHQFPPFAPLNPPDHV
jgi:protein tyrosine phosphatase (PTP) superfamily phosphohydrolase (DUF442 family)